ncbi:hypothetical protein LH29_10770 [Draconibacterium sediminis]|uniref:Uncharacterized protein n=1 Tax=Draconibacterium sediminis TaxID=1544798 RepID=A0A0D8JAP3_9BACT|nr:hypothetical protein LH29_10770 [Draconibacterium sediminis]
MEAPAKTVASGNWVLNNNTWKKYFNPVGIPEQLNCGIYLILKSTNTFLRSPIIGKQAEKKGFNLQNCTPIADWRERSSCRLRASFLSNRDEVKAGDEPALTHKNGYDT